MKKNAYGKGLLMIGMALLLPLSGFVVTVSAETDLASDVTLVATKLDGTQLSGKMIAWNAAEITLQTGEQEVTITSSQLLRAKWRQATPSEPINQAFIEFVDGTRVPHQAFEVQENVATVTTSLARQPIKISTDYIEFVQLSTDLIEREAIEHELAGDQLMIRKNKKGAIDSLTGVLGNISSKQVQFTWDGESIPVKRTKVVALTYFHARNPKGKDPVCWLNLFDGSRLPVVEWSVEKRSVEKQTVHVRTTSDLELSFPLDWLLEADYSQGKFAYLSDLKPIQQRWTPRIGLPESAALIRQHGLPRRDQSFTGSALALQWPASKTGVIDGELKTYGKGLAIRSRTKIRYRIPKGMKRFAALAGIDPETAKQGNVTLEIFADRRSIWQGEIDGELAPTEINVLLGDARELRLIVDYGKNLDFGDRLHLVEARLSR